MADLVETEVTVLISIKELCSLIGLPDEVTKKVLACDKSLKYGVIQTHMDKLFDRLTWNEGLEELRDALGRDPDGMKILTVQLKCLLKSRSRYEKKGIPLAVFIDTMRYLPRFLERYKNIYGSYKYDQDWWFTREIALSEFRIGTLEYEIGVTDRKRRIALHIPSDADLSFSALRKSYLDARIFLSTYFPPYADLEIFCSSWMLSPDLHKLLHMDSHILAFQSQFKLIQRQDDNQPEVFRWIYGRPDLSLDELPEHTSLQRSLKRYLQKGNHIGIALGQLIDDPFIECPMDLKKHA